MTTSGNTGGRPHVSLCMIVRDSARTLRPCLASIAPWVDELIVVDTGSTDDTPEIARSFGAHVHHFPWCDDFAVARNESLKYATGDWVFWMDSDDTITEENGRKLRDFASQSPADAPMAFVMQVHCPGAEGDDVTVVDHVKLFQNLPDLRFEGRIHEQILAAIRRLNGEVAWTDIFVTHSGSDHSPAGRHRKQQRDLRLLELELQDRPDHPFALFNVGMTYADMERHDEAVDSLRRSLAVSNTQESHVRKAYALLTSSLTQLDRLDEACAACTAGLQHYPHDAELHFRTGIIGQRQDRLDDAVAAYRAALDNREERHFSSMDPGIADHKARHNLAIVYTELGRHDLAEIQWRAIMDRRPGYRPAWRGLADCLLDQQRFATAQVESERMLEQSDTRGLGLVLQAELAVRQGEQDAARSTLQAAVEELPDDLDARQAACKFLFEFGDYEETEQAFLELIRLAPDDGAAHHNLGTHYFRCGKLEKAVQCYEASLQVRPDSAATCVQLAHALEAQGLLAAARDAWRRAAELSPRDESIPAALVRLPAAHDIA
jgi:tetratricopeptide (TPR) repeat protein